MLKINIGDTVVTLHGEGLVIGLHPDRLYYAILKKGGVILDQKLHDYGYKEFNIDPIHIGKEFYKYHFNEIKNIVNKFKIPEIGDTAVFRSYGECLIIGLDPTGQTCAAIISNGAGVELCKIHLDNGYKNYNIDPIHLGKRFYNLYVSEILSIIKRKIKKKTSCEICN